jgi:hypothetical protein
MNKSTQLAILWVSEKRPRTLARDLPEMLRRAIVEDPELAQSFALAAISSIDWIELHRALKPNVPSVPREQTLYRTDAPPSALREAWKRIRLPGLDFVELDKLGQEAGFEPEQLHAAIERELHFGTVSLTGQNLAILAPERRRYAFEYGGRKLFLLAFRANAE